MTNDKAVKLLHRIADEQFDGIHGDERREALSIAVRALEQNLVQESGDLVQDLVKDCISRKMAIDALAKWLYDVFGITESDGTATIFKRLRELPSAQPETHDKRTETHACDLINRQQAIDAVKDLPNCHNGFSDTYDKACIIGVLEDLPTAQTQRKSAYLIDPNPYGKCSNCGQLIDIRDGYNYCPNCGADMRGESDETICD